MLLCVLLKTSRENLLNAVEEDFTWKTSLFFPELKSCLWGSDIENVSAISLLGPVAALRLALYFGRLINKVFLRVFKTSCYRQVTDEAVNTVAWQSICIAVSPSRSHLSFIGHPFRVSHYTRWILRQNTFSIFLRAVILCSQIGEPRASMVRKKLVSSESKESAESPRAEITAGCDDFSSSIAPRCSRHFRRKSLRNLRGRWIFLAFVSCKFRSFLVSLPGSMIHSL